PFMVFSLLLQTVCRASRPLYTPPPLHSSLPFLFHCSRPHRALPSFPTRRSSDLPDVALFNVQQLNAPGIEGACAWFRGIMNTFEDRKSTRLNSSHGSISYAVFCLKKKKKKKKIINEQQ